MGGSHLAGAAMLADRDKKGAALAEKIDAGAKEEQEGRNAAATSSTSGGASLATRYPILSTCIGILASEPFSPGCLDHRVRL